MQWYYFFNNLIKIRSSIRSSFFLSLPRVATRKKKDKERGADWGSDFNQIDKVNNGFFLLLLNQHYDNHTCLLIWTVFSGEHCCPWASCYWSPDSFRWPIAMGWRLSSCVIYLLHVTSCSQELLGGNLNHICFVAFVG